MWHAEPSDPLYPVGQIFRLDKDSVIPEPELIYNYNNGMDLIVVSGCITESENVATAIKLANTRRAGTITIAVMNAGDDGESNRANILGSTHLKQLHEAFDSVFLVSEREACNVVNRVARAIVTPGSSDQFACCDWNDMRTIVGGEKSGRLGRYGFGRGQGEDCASQAMQAALYHLNQQEHGIGDAPGVITIVTGAQKSFKGRFMKEVAQTTCIQAPACTSIARGHEFDDTFADDVVEVDIFAFGGPAT